MRIFKTKWFVRFARKEKIENVVLCEAMARAEKGLIDADLGGGLIKQRIARPGAGKSGGFRTVVAYRAGEKAFFIYGFAKSTQENLTPVELGAFQEVALTLFGMSDAEIALEIKRGKQMEIMWNDEDL
jgi:hypothetical protein